MKWNFPKTPDNHDVLRIPFPEEESIVDVDIACIIEIDRNVVAYVGSSGKSSF